MVAYFLDTYALIEITKENQNFVKYLEEEMYTSIFNLYELYYQILRDYDEETAREKFLQFKKILIHYNDEIIFKASKFKFQYRKDKISYVDALGYTIAMENGFKFLTGDKEFRNKENVEFVK